MEGSTRISDLPDNITMSSNGPVATGGNLESTQPVTSGYTPMNTHPNPYGQGPPAQMPHPQQTKINANGSQGGNPYLDQGIDQHGFVDTNLSGPHAHLHGMPQFPLPQRDIPMDTTGYMHDDAIKPNYVPVASSSAKYAGQGYVETQEDRVRRQKKVRKGKLFSGNWTVDDVIAELQQPIIVGILFFIFQSPVIHSSMGKYLAFMKLFHDDGNINTTGILIKSVLFGLCYFMWGRFMEYLDIE
jgi:hypothetical protein